MGNHGTTMFDELRGCSITIHWPHSHQFRTPLGSSSGFQGSKYVFSSALRFFAPAHVNGLRNKNKTENFLPRTNPWANRGQTVERHQKVMERHKKVVERHKKVVDTGIKYPKTGICCVLSIDAKNSWMKCRGLPVGSMWDHARNLGNMYFRSCFLFALVILKSEGTPGRHWEKHVVAYSCTECQFAIQWDRKSSFWRYMPKIPFDVFCHWNRSSVKDPPKQGLLTLGVYK